MQAVRQGREEAAQVVHRKHTEEASAPHGHGGQRHKLGQTKGCAHNARPHGWQDRGEVAPPQRSPGLAGPRGDPPARAEGSLLPVRWLARLRELLVLRRGLILPTMVLIS